MQGSFLNTQSPVLMPLSYVAFENIVGKEENAGKWGSIQLVNFKSQVI